MIYIYDYNTHELIGEFKSLGRAALGLGLPNIHPIAYNIDRVTKGYRAPVVHRKKSIAVYILSHKFVMKNATN